MENALLITRGDHHPPKVEARRDPTGDVLSETDVEILREACMRPSKSSAYFKARSIFLSQLHRSFFIRLESPFLRPDPHVS
jgi:hypothetical protein